VDPLDVKELVAGGVQAAGQSLKAAWTRAEAYKTANRTFGYDLKNGTQLLALQQYTAARLQFEARLREGEE
jgi:hypothetical protein